MSMRVSDVMVVMRRSMFVVWLTGAQCSLQWAGLAVLDFCHMMHIKCDSSRDDMRKTYCRSVPRHFVSFFVVQNKFVQRTKEYQASCWCAGRLITTRSHRSGFSGFITYQELLSWLHDMQDECFADSTRYALTNVSSYKAYPWFTHCPTSPLTSVPKGTMWCLLAHCKACSMKKLYCSFWV